MIELHEEGMAAREIDRELGLGNGAAGKVIKAAGEKSPLAKNLHQEPVQQNSNTIPTSTPEEQATLLKPKGEKEAHKGYVEAFNTEKDEIPDEMFADEGHPESHVFKREAASALGGGYAKVFELHEGGMSNLAIGKEIGVADTTVARVIESSAKPSVTEMQNEEPAQNIRK